MKAQKAYLLVGVLLGLALGAFGSDLRTWTFGQDGQMQTPSGGTVSFRKKGRLDAVFVRADGTNVVLQAARGEPLSIPLAKLSDPDRFYIARLTGAEFAQPSAVPKTAIEQNELSRRKVEAAKLRNDATEKRRLAQAELDAAAKLEVEAEFLVSKIVPEQALVDVPPDEQGSNAAVSSLIPKISCDQTNGDLAFAAGAKAQLQEDVAKLKSQAQEKRQRADKLQREAKKLEETAAAELAPSAHPTKL